MNEIISSDEIKNSETYKNSEKMYQNILLRYDTKKKITDGIIIFKNSEVYAGSLGGVILRIVKELTKKLKK